MLVTHYAGTKMVRVYNAGIADADPARRRVTSAIEVESRLATKPDVDEVDNVALKSEGTYYPAGDQQKRIEVHLTFGDAVAATARSKEVFSYKDPSAGELDNP